MGRFRSSERSSAVELMAHIFTDEDRGNPEMFTIRKYRRGGTPILIPRQLSEGARICKACGFQSYELSMENSIFRLRVPTSAEIVKN